MSQESKTQPVSQPPRVGVLQPGTWFVVRPWDGQVVLVQEHDPK